MSAISKSEKLSFNFGTVSTNKLIAESTETKIVSLTTTSYTSGNSDAGKTFIMNHTSGTAIILPSPTSGYNATFIVGVTAPAHVITSPSTSIWGTVAFGNGTQGSLGVTVAQTNIHTTTGSVIGDSFTLVSDGSKYYLRGITANFNGMRYSI